MFKLSNVQMLHLLALVKISCSSVWKLEPFKHDSLTIIDSLNTWQFETQMILFTLSNLQSFKLSNVWHFQTSFFQTFEELPYFRPRMDRQLVRFLTRCLKNLTHHVWCFTCASTQCRPRARWLACFLPRPAVAPAPLLHDSTFTYWEATTLQRLASGNNPFMLTLTPPQ